MIKEKIKRKIKGITGVGFEFVEDGHSYYLDGVRLTGVTTVLDVKSKPFLIQWAADMAVQHIQNNMVNFAPSSTEFILDLFDKFTNEARTAHRKTKEAAGEKGKDVHSIIEGIIKSAMEKTGGYVVVEENADKSLIFNDQVRHFIAWAIENKVRFLASEERIFSRELFMGGTIDFLCEIDGEVWIGDIKTSKGIYAEHFFQTAGYQKIMEDMAETDNGMMLNVKGHVILNLRKDGTFEEKRSVSNEDNRKAFLACVELYRIDKKLKGTII